MKRAFNTIVAAIILLSLAGPVVASPLEDAAAAYDRGDYATALRLLRPLADQGDAAAQTKLGEMYYNGRGAPQDYAEMVKWFRKAADQGYAQAQSSLGIVYSVGRGVPQNHAEAEKWFRKAAAQGNAAAPTDGATPGEWRLPPPRYDRPGFYPPAPKKPKLEDMTIEERAFYLFPGQGAQRERNAYIIDEMRAAADRQQGNSYSIHVK
jgi:TPR repeat protein